MRAKDVNTTLTFWWIASVQEVTCRMHLAGGAMPVMEMRQVEPAGRCSQITYKESFYGQRAVGFCSEQVPRERTPVSSDTMEKGKYPNDMVWPER